MSPTPPTTGPSGLLAAMTSFEALDACHRQIVASLAQLAALVARLEQDPADPQVRTVAGEIVEFFRTTVRQHHLDEERYVFPRLIDSDDPEIVHAVLRLKQDHHWMDVDWKELSPLLEAVAAGHSGYDIETLREGAAIFTLLSQEHIALEETCIYPEARARLQAAALHQTGREMAHSLRTRRRREKESKSDSIDKPAT